MQRKRPTRTTTAGLLGAGSSTTRPDTPAGPGSSRVEVIDDDGLAIWRECFASAIAGTCAAQRIRPNPKIVTRHAALIADCALEAARERQKVRDFSQNRADQ